MSRLGAVVMLSCAAVYYYFGSPVVATAMLIAGLCFAAMAYAKR